MSILPYLLDELSCPTVYDQHFGLGLLDNELQLHPRRFGYNRCPFLTKSYRRPLRLRSASQSGLSRIRNDRKQFKINLDVQQFKPDEVSVVVKNGYLVVDGKHEERSDEHGFVSRQFTRRYKIPENVDTEAITSTLSSDGILSVGAPKKVLDKAANERTVQIVQTNEPNIKEAPSKNNENENDEFMDTNQ